LNASVSPAGRSHVFKATTTGARHGTRSMHVHVKAVAARPECMLAWPLLVLVLVLLLLHPLSLLLLSWILISSASEERVCVCTSVSAAPTEEGAGAGASYTALRSPTDDGTSCTVDAWRAVPPAPALRCAASSAKSALGLWYARSALEHPCECGGGSTSTRSTSEPRTLRPVARLPYVYTPAQGHSRATTLRTCSMHCERTPSSTSFSRLTSRQCCSSVRGRKG
jgi:hypothetical protein